MNILRLALTGLFRKKFYTLLLFAVCFAAMQTVLSGIHDMIVAEVPDICMNILQNSVSRRFLKPA